MELVPRDEEIVPDASEQVRRFRAAIIDTRGLRYIHVLSRGLGDYEDGSREMGSVLGAIIAEVGPSAARREN